MINIPLNHQWSIRPGIADDDGGEDPTEGAHDNLKL